MDLAWYAIVFSFMIFALHLYSMDMCMWCVMDLIVCVVHSSSILNFCAAGTTLPIIISLLSDFSIVAVMTLESRSPTDSLFRSFLFRGVVFFCGVVFLRFFRRAEAHKLEGLLALEVSAATEEHNVKKNS